MKNEPTAPSATQTSDTRRPESTLTPRQLTAIDLLFAGRSYVAVCRELGIDTKTLYRWRQSDDFAAEVKRRYARGVVARKSRSRPGPLLPPPLETQPLPDHFNSPPRDDDDYWSQLVHSGRDLPPPRDDEPFWFREIRRSREALKAAKSARQSPFD